MNKSLVFLLVLLVCVAGVILYLSSREGVEIRSEGEKYNLLIIVSDALRADGLGCYGGRTKTPNIDALAAEGVLFENARCTAPWTSPSSVTLFTGNYSSAYPMELETVKGSTRKRIRYHVPDDELLLSEALGHLGYEVRMSVENPYASLHNNVQGFERLDRFAKIGEEVQRRVDQQTGFRNFESTRYEEMYGPLDYLLQVSRDQPFCLLKWFNDPHAPHDPPAPFRSGIDVDPSSLPEDASFYSSVLNADNFKKDHGRDLTDPESRYIKALYEREIASMDERVGYIVNTLKQRGLFENTFILFTSDHGEHFGEHGLYCHSNSYFEELLHVPLILCGPGIARGKKVSEPVSHLDLIPTLRELMRVDFPGRMQGKSYRDLISGKKIKARSHYFTGAKQGYVYVDSLVEDHFKLIVKKEEEKLLFDLSRDRSETNNLASLQKDRTNDMYGRLLKIRKYNDYLKKLNAGKGSAVDLGTEEDQEIVDELKALGYL